ncbi:MAG: hypothetical protein KAH54_11695 [Candidatus Sabulitectum sp.]|nr:hypothetical protein [Candidatus Sabulitectum sp.]
MKFSITTSALLFFLILSCGMAPQVEDMNTISEFTPPDDPGLAVYRETIFTVDLHLLPRNEIDWETAVHIPSIQVTYDDNGRITEIVGLWMGRPSDRVNVASFSPMLRISYEPGIETVSFHWADGEPFREMGFCGYRIAGSDNDVFSTMEFLQENGSVLIDPSGIAYRQIENEGEGWYIETMHDENDALVPFSENGVYAVRQRLNSLKDQIATENTDSLGNLLPLFEEVYLIERDFNSAGHLIEVKRYDSDGNVFESPDSPGWETYEVSPSGLTTAFSVLDPDGSPAVDLYGVSTHMIEYDQFGRITRTKRYDINGDPTTIAGVWGTEKEYDDDLLQTTSTTFDHNGEPVDSNGFATVVTVSDVSGNSNSISFYDSDGDPAFDNIDVHQYRFIYTTHSKLLERQIWNSSGAPDTCSLGFHNELYAYDELGNFLGTEYQDVNGQTITY